MPRKAHSAVALLVAALSSTALGQPAVSPSDSAPTPRTAASPATQPAVELSAAEQDWGAVPDAQTGTPKSFGTVGNAANTGSRGDSDPDLKLAAVASTGVDKTVQSSPKLYWHLSKDTDQPIILAITRGNESSPRRLELTGRKAAGFHVLDPSALGMTLETGVTYEWVVALVQDPRYRSKDLVVSGLVQRVLVEPELLGRLQNASPISRVTLLEQSGLGVDAYEQAISAIEARPDLPQARAYRDALLSQMALTQTSAAEIRSEKR